MRSYPAGAKAAWNLKSWKPDCSRSPVWMEGKEMRDWNKIYHARLKEFSLYGKVIDPGRLGRAWVSVRSNRGSGGVDEVSIGTFEKNLEENLQELHRVLKNKEYEPQPVRRVLIPKDNGKFRPLGIPTIRDRVVQESLKTVLEPIFEGIFLPCSHGYRPGKDPHLALRKARAYIKHGMNWVVDADIEGFFDHVDHKILVDLLSEQIADGTVLELVESMLRAGVMTGDQFAETDEGTPQGGVISPLLANVYLNHFDRRMGEEGYLIVRYADDFLIFCKSELDANWALETARTILRDELKLNLNESKTKIVNMEEDSIEFLGFDFNKGRFNPKKKAVERFKAKIRNGTRRQQPKNLKMVIDSVNPIIRGWGLYFRNLTRKSLFWNLDQWIRGRLRSFKRKKRTGIVIRFAIPIAEFRQLGLFSLKSILP